MTRAVPSARRTFRTALAAVTVLLLGLALPGCVPDRPGNAADWLRGQNGVVSAEVIANHGGEFQSSGISRGELKPDLSDGDFDSLVKAVEGYLNTHDQVSIRLGRDGIDFTVSNVHSETTTAIGLWHSLAGIPKIANALARGDNSVHVRTLRTDTVEVLGALASLGADVSIEGLADAAAIASDTSQDDFFGDDIFNLNTLGLHWPVNCTPPPAELTLAESFLSRAEISGGDIELCSSFDLYYTAESSLAALLPPLYAELVDAGLTVFPVTAHQIVASAPDGHLVAVTPGNPAALGVLAAFEVDGAPDVYYELDSDSSFGVTEYDTPTGDLLTLLSASPVAATLPLIRIEGDSSAISGTLDQLPSMLAQVTALVAASDIFTNVELGPDTGFLDLNSPVATDPDVTAAVTALRASGATTGRTFTVEYISARATIVDGVATVNDNYTDPHVINAFIDAWNSSAG